MAPPLSEREAATAARYGGSHRRAPQRGPPCRASPRELCPGAATVSLGSATGVLARCCAAPPSLPPCARQGGTARRRLGFFPCASNEDTLHVSREVKTVYFETVCDALRLSLHRCFLNRFNLHQQFSVVRATPFGEPIRDEYGLGAPPEIAVPTGGPALVSEERRLAGPHALEPENVIPRPVLPPPAIFSDSRAAAQPPLRAPRDDPIGLDTYVVPLLHEVRAAKERAAGGENFEEARRPGVRQGAALARLRTFLRAGDLAGAMAAQADVDNLQRLVGGIVAAARAGRGPIPDVPGAPPTPPLPPAPEPGAAAGAAGDLKGGARGRIPLWPRPKAGDDPFEVLDAFRAAIVGLLCEDPEDELLAAAAADEPPAWWGKPSKPQAKKNPVRSGEEPSSPPPASQRKARRRFPLAPQAAGPPLAPFLPVSRLRRSLFRACGATLLASAAPRCPAYPPPPPPPVFAPSGALPAPPSDSPPRAAVRRGEGPTGPKRHSGAGSSGHVGPPAPARPPSSSARGPPPPAASGPYASSRPVVFLSFAIAHCEA
eukprot:tig00000396_g24912.t3